MPVYSTLGIGSITVKNRNFWELGENILLFGAGVGSVASVVAQQAFYAAAPLSFLFLLNLINRRRFEQVTHRSMTATISKIDQQLSNEIQALRQQVASMPDHTQLAGTSSKLSQRQDEGIAKLRREVLQQLKAFEEKHLSSVGQSIEGIQKQQAQATEAINGLSGYLHRLAPVGRVDAIESNMSHLKTEFNQLQSTLQNLLNEPKPNLNALQDQINHINRRLNNLPPPFDPTALKQDIDAIIKLAGDLVPKREMSRLIYEIETVQQQLKAFEQMLTPLRLGATVFKKQLDTVMARLDHGEQSGHASTDEMLRLEIENLQLQFAELSQTMEALQHQNISPQQGHQYNSQLLNPDFTADLSPELAAELSAIHLSEIAEFTGIDLTNLDDVDLDQQLDEVMRMFEQDHTQDNTETAPSLLSELAHHPNGHNLEQQLAQILNRVEHVEQQLERSNALPGSPTKPTSSPAYELMFALQEPHSLPTSTHHPSILEDVLAQAEHSLTIVFPSPTYCNFSPSLLQAIRAFLQRRGQIEIGLGYLTDLDHDRVNRCLDPYWQTPSKHHDLFYQALKQLSQLKRDYPQQFTFKVLGTDENFVICDRTFAVLGVQNLTIASDLYPGLNIGLRTYDARVVESLSHRFNAPILNDQDAAACFNRAMTCYELGDRTSAISHYTQALRLNPQDDIAYNNRGVIYAELGRKQEAMADFREAVMINPRNVNAQFNLGYINADMDDRAAAIVSYTRAIEHAPRLVAAYFHRGLARTRTGDKLGAITDYSHVIQLDPTAAIAYFYRGLAHTKLGNNWSALQDFRQAVSLFTQQGNSTHLDKANTMLQKLEQLAPIADPPARPVAPPPPAPVPAPVPHGDRLYVGTTEESRSQLEPPSASVTYMPALTASPDDTAESVIPISPEEQTTIAIPESAVPEPALEESGEWLTLGLAELSASPVAVPALPESDAIVTLETMFFGADALFPATTLDTDSVSADSVAMVPTPSGVPTVLEPISVVPDRHPPELQQSTTTAQPHNPPAHKPYQEADSTLTLEHLFPSDNDLSGNPHYPSFHDLFPDQAPTPENPGLSFQDLFPDEQVQAPNSSIASPTPDESTLTLEHLF